MPEVSFDISAAGWLESSSTTYSTARAGTGTLTVGTGDSIIGQQLSAGTYRIREAFYAFDTSSIPVGSTISAARLEATNWGDNSTTDFTINARPYAATRGPWGPTLATSDWIAGANLATYTDAAKGATQATSSLPALYTGFTFTDANLVGAVVMGGTTELVVYSSRTSGNNTPTGDEFVTIATGGVRPHLVVTYTAASGGGGGSGLKVEFRSRGWSGSAETFGTWREITCDVIGAGWARGSSEHRGLLNTPETVQANVQLYDPDRDLDPANTVGPYYGQIDVGADIRLTFVTRVVFTGRITTLDHVLHTPDASGNAYSIASIDATSYQGKIALTNLIGLAADRQAVFETDENTYARINRILDYCGIAAGDRDIEAGGVEHWDYNVKWNNGNGNAWDNLVMTMRSELGSLEVTTAGVVRTRNRNTVWNTTPATTLQLGCHAGAIPVYEAEFATVRDTVRNSVNTTWENINSDEGGPDLTDATSIAKYGQRAYSEELGLAPQPGTFPGSPPYTSVQHETWKAYFLARMKNPQKQWRVVTRPTTQAQIDMIETTYLYTGRARLTIDQSGPPIDKTLRFIGVEWSVDPEGKVARIALGEP